MVQAREFLNTVDFYQEESFKNGKLISVVIPMYNEENTITAVINRIPKKLNYEVIIVDDGSTDNSVQRILELKDNNVKVISHVKNQGYTGSILTGISNSKGEIIVTMDADGQHRPEEIPIVIKPIIENQADFVVGSRYLGECTYRVPIHTRIGEMGIDLSLKLLYGQGCGNNQSGFRAFHRKNATIFKDMIYSRFGLCTEILFKAGHLKLNLLEVPITIVPRIDGNSHVNVIAIMSSIFNCIMTYAFKKININAEKFFLKKFIDRIFNRIKHLKLF